MIDLGADIIFGGHPRGGTHEIIEKMVRRNLSSLHGQWLSNQQTVRTTECGVMEARSHEKGQTTSIKIEPHPLGSPGNHRKPCEKMVSKTKPMTSRFLAKITVPGNTLKSP